MNIEPHSFLNISPESPFSIHNLPYGVFSTENNPSRRVGVAIGDFVLDLSALEELGLFPDLPRVFSNPSLNEFMALGKSHWDYARNGLQKILSVEDPYLNGNVQLQKQLFVPMDKVTLHPPVSVGGFTDFYASKEHARNVGIMFRGDGEALMPNWTHLPVAYHGRASSIVMSGYEIQRPWGQISNNGISPTFSPSKEVDFELEMGILVGIGNPLGKPISVHQAQNHIFGIVLLNDWSARDIQRWEYKPLGPFLGKNFATSISPWVVPLSALEPFRCKGPEKVPEPLAYLRDDNSWAIDIQLEVSLQTRNMTVPEVISRSNFKYLYWNINQLIAHHTINGCNLQTGDLLGSGTISGTTPDSFGSMLELAWRGEKPITFTNGEARTFLEDGDTVILKGLCKGNGYRVGFGEVRGRIISNKNFT